MVLPIQSLMNMESQLYGGLGNITDAPNYFNGYCMNSSLFTDMMNSPYYGYNPSFQHNPASANANGGTNVSMGANDQSCLKKFYEDSKKCVQTWGSLPMSAAMIAMMENPQAIFHPINIFKGKGATNKIFDMTDDAIKNLWTKNPHLMQKAYAATNSINARNHSKIGAFVKRMDAHDVDKLNDIMRKALKTGNEAEILRAAETLNAAKGCDGFIPTAWNKIKGFFTGKKINNPTPFERITNKAAVIDKAVADAPKLMKPGAAGLLKEGVKNGAFTSIFFLLMDLPKIISAKKNGGNEAMAKQIGQTGVKALADGIGWVAGQAAGRAIGTKLGASIGTAICPGVGTAIGAALGWIGGAAGSILASKVCDKLIPADVATKLEAEKAVSTPEGQAELVTLIQQKLQAGEEIPQEVIVAAQNILNNQTAATTNNPFAQGQYNYGYGYGA